MNIKKIVTHLAIPLAVIGAAYACGRLIEYTDKKSYQGNSAYTHQLITKGIPATIKSLENCMVKEGDNCGDYLDELVAIHRRDYYDELHPLDLKQFESDITSVTEPLDSFFREATNPDVDKPYRTSFGDSSFKSALSSVLSEVKKRAESYQPRIYYPEKPYARNWAIGGGLLVAFCYTTIGIHWLLRHLIRERKH